MQLVFNADDARFGRFIFLMMQCTPRSPHYKLVFHHQKRKPVCHRIAKSHASRSNNPIYLESNRPFATISQISSTFIRELQPRYNDIPERPCVTISNRPISPPSLSLFLSPCPLFRRPVISSSTGIFTIEGIESNNNVGTER